MVSRGGVEGVRVDCKEKNAVKEREEFGKIPRTTAEKGDRLLLVGDQGFDFVSIPNVVLGREDFRVLVREGIRRCTRFRIALIPQFPVTMNGLVAAPLQFCADRRFAGAGNAFNQIISPAHGKMLPTTS